MNNARLSLDDLNARIDLRQLVTQDMGHGRLAGDSVRYWNPPWSSAAHHSGSPAFAVFANGFKDFSGGDHGDVIDYIARRDNLTRADAIQRLREYVEGKPSAPAVRGAEHPTTGSESEPPSVEWQHCVETEAVTPSVTYLWSGAADANRVLNYLRQERHLSDETIRRAELGYNPRRKYLSHHVNGKPICLHAGITIPRRAAGALWALNVRQHVGIFAAAVGVRPLTNEDGKAADKYLNIKGSKLGALYGFDELRPGVDVIFVEGEFDVLLMQQELGDSGNAVTLGAASITLKARWRKAVDRCGLVFATLDDDTAGERATDRLLKVLPHLKLLKLPAGKDATDFVRHHDGDLASWWAARINAEVSDSNHPSIPETPGVMFPDGVVPDEMQKAINHFAFKQKGIAIVYALVQRGMALGIIPTTGRYSREQVDETAFRIGWSVPKNTMDRYFQEEIPFLHPRNAELGCSFGNEREILPIADVKTALKRLRKIELHVKYFRSKERIAEDLTTGKAYTLPVVPADLPTQAFIDAGMDEVSARRAAEALQDDSLSFDFPTDKRRAAATHKARTEYEKFCQWLDDPHTVPPAEDVQIVNERTFKRALARAWHAAGIARFTTQAEQMWALGFVSKHTLNECLQAGGVEKEAQIEAVMLDPAQDVGKQVRASIRNLGAMPVTYYTIDEETGEKKRGIYSGAVVEQAQTGGVRVFVEYQKANEHHVVGLPPVSERAEQPRREKIDMGEKPAAPRVKRAVPTPGTYPIEWTLNHLHYRYRLHFKLPAPDALTVAQLAEAIAVRILIEGMERMGAQVKEIA